MQAVILAGGKSKSMLPITETKAKVLVSMMNKPLLIRTLEWLPKGVDEVFITCNWQAEEIKKYVNEIRKDFEPRIEIVVEDRNLGSAGAVKNLQDKLEGDFLIISGDVIGSLNIENLVAAHKEKEADLTLGVFSVSNPCDYGIISMDDKGKVTRFTEKPKPDLVFSTLTNTGVYVSNTKIMEYIPRLSYYDIAIDLLPYILKKDFKIYGHQFYGFWMDLGRPERLLDAHKMLLQRTMEFNVESDIDSRLLPPLVIGKNCDLKGIIGPEVCIGNKVKSADAKIAGSVIFDNVKIGKKVIIKDSIICEGCKIGNKSIIEGAIIAEGCTIKSGVKVSRNAKVWPNLKIEEDIPEDELYGAPEKR